MPVLKWLAGSAVGDALASLAVNRAKAAEAEEQMRTTHIHALGMTAEQSAARLEGLRSGTVTGTNTTEVTYAALFEPVRVARVAFLASMAGEPGAFAFPDVEALRAGTGAVAPLADAATVLAVDPVLVTWGCAQATETLLAAAALSRLLTTAYGGLDLDAGAIGRRLRCLALGTGDTPATDTERAFADLFVHNRDFVQAIADRMTQAIVGPA